MLYTDFLVSVKNYLRIDYDDDDPLIESFIYAAKQYLIGAGITEQSDNELYKLVVMMLVALFYENRNTEMKIPALIINFIAQLSITSRTV